MAQDKSFVNFQPNFSAEQWRNLHASFTTVHNSLTNVDSDNGIEVHKFVDLRDKLRHKKQNVSNESVDKCHELKFVDLREKLREKRRIVLNESESGDNGSEIDKFRWNKVDKRQKLVDLGEKLEEKRCSVSNESESGDNESFDKCGRSVVDMRQKLVDLRVKLTEKGDSDSNERGIDDNVSGGQSGIDARQKLVDLGGNLKEIGRSLVQGDELVGEKITEERCEKSNVIELYNELYVALELKEKRVNEECGKLESKEKLISSARQALELKEEEIKHKCEALESREKGINEISRVFEVKEMDLDRRCERVGAKERDLESRRKQLDKRAKSIAVKEKNVMEFRRVLESKEKNLLERLELNDKLFEERFAAIKSMEMSLDLKEKEMAERCVGIKVKEMDKRFAAIKSKEMSLESKEKEIKERCIAIKLKEELAMSELFKAVEWKLNQMNKRFDALEMVKGDSPDRNHNFGLFGDDLRGKEINDANEGLVLKEKKVGECCIGGHCQEQEKEEKQGNAPCEDLESMDAKVNNDVSNSTEDLKGKQVNDANEGLGLKNKNVGECGVGDDCKEHEKQANAPCEGLEFMDTQVNIYVSDLSEDMRGKEINDELRLKEKEVSECCVGGHFQEQEKEEKQVNAPCEDLELMDTKINKYIEPRGIIETQINESSHQLGSKKKRVRRKPLKLIVKHINEFNSQLETEETTQIVDNGDVAECKSDSCKHNVPMNGKALQTYLNERTDKHESMEEQIKSMLRSLEDPAKLVLDAVDGFYAPAMC